MVKHPKPPTLCIYLYTNFELGGNAWWFACFLAQHIAIFSYFMTILIKSLAFPDGLLINGQTHATTNGDQGKAVFRILNVRMSTSINFRIQGHTLKLVEVEGSYVIQNIYDTLDVHVGQSAAVLVTLNQSPKDYYIVAST
ncbi:hypothetical protein P8452_27979 [Trifolium repens]|nr:hypothetical protein P8452_27979 [Trifolium repens]